jgi:twitching motility protein PilT
MSLPDLLKATLDLGGSDLHLSIGSVPQVRVDGHLRPLGQHPPLTADVTKALAYSVLTDAQKKKFEETWELDLAFGLRGVGRFRCNVFNQKGAVGAVFRLIPEKIRPLEELGLPQVLAEDPIEYLHQHQKALINQRELHADTQSFTMALRAALREDPDVVLIGEMRDLETMEAALKLAETGHLTLATLHTNSAAQTINRIIDAFPAGQQAQIRTQLSLVLEGIVCQALMPKASGQGRVAALEVLIATPGIRNLIRDDKIHQIYGTMQAGQERFGMMTMNQSLARLVEKRLITRDVALATSSNRDELLTLFERGAPAALAAAMPARRLPIRQEA